jgi:hypothetical protein
MFDRVCVISLDRRPDRLATFFAGLPTDFPFGKVEVVPAIDGSKCRHPSWWRQGGGAWGCYRSHVRIIEDALNAGHENILIFEDDATFAPGFAAKAREYLAALPSDWVQAYFGGQHLRPPLAVPGNRLVVRASNVNRTHAYAIRGRVGMLRLYRWLHASDQWKNGFHIDHHYGRMHKEQRSGFYAPANWLCGQAAGQSNISGKQTVERWWKGRAAAAEPAAAGSTAERKFVAVMGLHRSGSSACAMVLHKLGVSMGDKLGGYEGRNGGGGEARGLAAICERAARFPSPLITMDRLELARQISGWVRRRFIGRTIAGGKYPHLCAMGPELVEAAGDALRVVVCDRPLDESIESLRRRSKDAKGWLAITDAEAEAVQRWLSQEREAFLRTFPAERVYRVDWRAMQEDPAAVVGELVEFLGMEPTAAQLSAAVAHIKTGEPCAVAC